MFLAHGVTFSVWWRCYEVLYALFRSGAGRHAAGAAGLHDVLGAGLGAISAGRLSGVCIRLGA
jgi:hypothetical protein